MVATKIKFQRKKVPTQRDPFEFLSSLQQQQQQQPHLIGCGKYRTIVSAISITLLLGEYTRGTPLPLVALTPPHSKHEDCMS